MKFDNKTFQQKYEAWKNGADYWKDIRGINLGGNTQADEPSPEEQLQMDQNVQSILNAYNEGKDANIAEEIIKPLILEYSGRVSWGISTNGSLLTKEILKFFYDNNVKILLSIDGPASVHDLQRKTKDGEPSFYLIEKWLKIISEFFK